MTSPNVYLPYPYPQNLDELKEDIQALVNQPEVPQELQDEVLNAENSPQVQAEVDEAEANSDSMANE
jgi:hypothetical protein